jgi:hypothetical protein
MKLLFNVHAGEYLVGSQIEKTNKHWSVWVPSKDTGVDLLITDSRNRKAVSLQAKFSKDFTPQHRVVLTQRKLMAMGWWTLQKQKIQNSQADFWVFVLPSFFEHKTSFIIIQPGELLRRLRLIRRTIGKRIDLYLWVTRTNRCWEARNLSINEEERIADDRFSNKPRDFGAFLNAWHQVAARLK